MCVAVSIAEPAVFTTIVENAVNAPFAGTSMRWMTSSPASPHDPTTSDA
jgi:hypothetical protein